MGKSRTKQAKKILLKEYEERLVTNFIVKTKTPVALDPDKVARVFLKATDCFPGMLRTTYPSDEQPRNDGYELTERASSDPTQPLRTLQLTERQLAIAACHPLSSTQQRNTIRELVKVLDGMGLVKPIAIEYVDVKFVFEFNYLGNHHGQILDILFKGSCLDRVSKEVGGEPTGFSPGLLIQHPTDHSLRFLFELQPRTTMREIESGKYDGDHIAAVCSAIKLRDFKPEEDLAKIHTFLHKECLRIVTESYLSSVVEPLHRELGG